MIHILDFHSRRISLTALAAAILASSAACSKTGPAGPAAGGGGAPHKIRFKTDWYPEAEHGGFYQALAKGFYREAGLDVEIVPGGPGVTVPNFILAGQVDIAMVRSDDIISDVSKGLPFVIVGAYMEHDPQAILVHEDGPVKAFGDLNGRTIMAVPGSNWIEYIKHHYRINFSLIPSNFGIAQFMADRNFIQQCFVTNEPYYVRKFGGHPRTLLLADSGFDPYRALFTTQGYAGGHAADVRAFIAASLRGWDDFMKGDPSPAKALILAENSNMTEDFMDYSIKAMRDEHIVFGKAENGERLGLMTRRRMQQQVDDLAQLRIIPELIPVDKFARFDLMPADLQSGAQ